MPATTVQGGKKKKSGPKNSALARPVKISEDLEAIVGKGPMARSMIVSKLWVYIKKHKLQKESDKRVIIPDATFAKAFGKTEFTMFEMNRKLNAHVKKIE